MVKKSLSDAEERGLRYVKMQTGIALATLLLTPLFSGLVVKYQFVQEAGRKQAQDKEEVLVDFKRAYSGYRNALESLEAVQFNQCLHKAVKEVLGEQRGNPEIQKILNETEVSTEKYLEAVTIRHQRFADLDTTLFRSHLKFGPTVRAKIRAYQASWRSLNDDEIVNSIYCDKQIDPMKELLVKVKEGIAPDKFRELAANAILALDHQETNAKEWRFLNEIGKEMEVEISTSTHSTR